MNRRLRTLAGLGGWAVAGALVLAGHGGALWAARGWHPVDAAPQGAAAPAIIMNLPPVDTAPQAPPEQIALASPVQPAVPAEEAPTETPPVTQPDPAQTQADAPPTETQTETETAQAEDEPPPPAEATEPDPVQADTPPVEEPEVKVPEMPEKDNAAAVLAATPPEQPKSRRKAAQPDKRQAEKKRERPRPQRPTASPPAAQPRQPSRTATASQGASSVPASVISAWKGAVAAKIRRSLRPDRDGKIGSGFVAFTMSRSGGVLSVRLARSTGDPALDAEALAAVRRSSPLPTPPPGFGGATILFSVPVRFTRE